MYEKYGNWFEMGPYGSVGAHIKTGKRSMAPDQFQTPPDPKKGYKNHKNPKKIKQNQKNAPEILSIYGIVLSAPLSR